jgi:hypothetical protein
MQKFEKQPETLFFIALVALLYSYPKRVPATPYKSLKACRVPPPFLANIASFCYNDTSGSKACFIVMCGA